MEMTTREAEYERLKAEYQPDPDDNPDCLKYNQAWYALRGLALADGFSAEEFKAAWHTLHSVVGWSQGEWKHMAPCYWQFRPSLPDKPQHRCCYIPRPHRGDPRELFKQQFKAKWPDKRLNSNFANEQWVKVQATAIAMIDEEYEQAMAEWQAKVDAFEARQAKEIAEWRADVERTERQRFLVETILGINEDPMFRKTEVA